MGTVVAAAMTTTADPNTNAIPGEQQH